jgi:hypothetical protein
MLEDWPLTLVSPPVVKAKSRMSDTGRCLHWGKLCGRRCLSGEGPELEGLPLMV